MNRYLKFFAFFGVPFGLVNGLMLSGFFRLDAFLGGVLMGLIFTAFVAAVDVWMTTRVRRRLEANGITVTSMDPLQVRHVQMSLSASVALEACVRVLREMPKAKLVTIDSATGTVTAETGITWSSFGERMTAEVRAHGGGSRITFTSVPLRQSNLMDGGKGAENVGTFLGGLSAA